MELFIINFNNTHFDTFVCFIIIHFILKPPINNIKVAHINHLRFHLYCITTTKNYAPRRKYPITIKKNYECYKHTKKQLYPIFRHCKFTRYCFFNIIFVNLHSIIKYRHTKRELSDYNEIIRRQRYFHQKSR